MRFCLVYISGAFQVFFHFSNLERKRSYLGKTFLLTMEISLTVQCTKIIMENPGAAFFLLLDAKTTSLPMRRTVRPYAWRCLV